MGKTFNACVLLRSSNFHAVSLHSMVARFLLSYNIKVTYCADEVGLKQRAAELK